MTIEPSPGLGIRLEFFPLAIRERDKLDAILVLFRCHWNVGFSFTYEVAGTLFFSFRLLRSGLLDGRGEGGGQISPVEGRDLCAVGRSVGLRR